MEMRHKVLSGSELFEFGGVPQQETVKDFWAWCRSRLIADGPRGDLAEFIVNTALGMDMTEPKHGWGECDIEYPYPGRDKPVRIEVKCSTYLQAWDSGKLSNPTFSIAKTLGNEVKETADGYWYVGRKKGDIPQRRSDIYVFCLFAEKERAKARPLALDQWEFYVVPTKTIDKELGNQKRINMKGLEKLRPRCCKYDELKATIDEVAAQLKLN